MVTNWTLDTLAVLRLVLQFELHVFWSKIELFVLPAVYVKTLLISTYEVLKHRKQKMGKTSNTSLPIVVFIFTTIKIASSVITMDSTDILQPFYNGTSELIQSIENRHFNDASANNRTVDSDNLMNELASELHTRKLNETE